MAVRKLRANIRIDTVHGDHYHNERGVPMRVKFGVHMGAAFVTSRFGNEIIRLVMPTPKAGARGFEKNRQLVFARM